MQCAIQSFPLLQKRDEEIMEHNVLYMDGTHGRRLDEGLASEFHIESLILGLTGCSEEYEG